MDGLCAHYNSYALSTRRAIGPDTIRASSIIIAFQNVHYKEKFRFDGADKLFIYQCRELLVRGKIEQLLHTLRRSTTSSLDNEVFLAGMIN